MGMSVTGEFMLIIYISGRVFSFFVQFPELNYVLGDM
jgi:hypothetical protein